MMDCLNKIIKISVGIISQKRGAICGMMYWGLIPCFTTSM